MAANTAPIFTIGSNLQIGGTIQGPNANTATDGTGVNTFLIFTASPTDGDFVQKVILKVSGTVAATVARLWYCSATGAYTAGTTNTTTNTAMLSEIPMLAFTASSTAASPAYEIPVNIMLPPNTKLLITFGTSTGAAGNGYNPVTVSGKYS